MSDEQNTGTTGASTGSTNEPGATGTTPAETSVGDAGIQSTQGQTGEQGGQQSGNEWLGEALRGNEALKSFKSADELAEAHLKHLENAKVPEKADAYTLTIPEGLQVDQNFVSASKEWALKAELTAAQFETFAAEYIANQQAGEKMISDAKDADSRALKLEWAGNYDSNLAAAVKVATNFFGKEFGEQLAKDPILRMVKGFHKLASMISEDSFMDGVGGRSSSNTVQLSETGTPMLSYPSMQNK